MSFKAIATGAIAVLLAVPVAAQQRGTIEFGAFGSVGRFDKSLTLDHGVGAGGHVGVFFAPRWALEFEKGEMRATRTLGLRSVNVGLLTGRLVATAIRSGRLSILMGAGAGAGTETNFLHSYGVNALLGAKLRLSDAVSLRVDGLADWLANNDWKSFQRVQAGLSFALNPHRITRSVEVPGPAATFVQRPDSVSADEQARRRRVEADYRALRDSLDRVRSMPLPPAPAPAPVTSAGIDERIHFATDKSDLTAEARAILDTKVLVFRANPSMRIIIVGSTDERASDAYNMLLGARRSSAAKAYLVAQGIDAGRIENSSAGERNPMAIGTSAGAQALNRRAEFRLLITADSPVRQDQ